MEAGVSIMEIQGEVYRYVLTIEPKGLGQRFEERRRGRPADVFNINNPEKTKHHCSPESRRNNEESYVA